MSKRVISLVLGCSLSWSAPPVSSAQELTPEQRAFMGIPSGRSPLEPRTTATGPAIKPLVGQAGLSKPEEPPGSSAEFPPMTFRIVVSGGASCCEWVAADGAITLETPQAFKDFLSIFEKDGAGRQDTIIFNSPGGDFFAALALGREIRRNTRFWTSVGRTELEPQKTQSAPLAYKVSGGVCLSACVLAFMGGKTRTYQHGDGSTQQGLAFQAFAIDQPASVLGRPSADAMAAAGLPAPGILRLLMEGYATEMGVDPTILAAMETAGQPGGLHLITQEEADRVGLNTPAAARTRWTLSVRHNGLVLYGSGEDRWTHYTVGLQCLGRDPGTLEYTIAVPAALDNRESGHTEGDYKQGITSAFLRNTAGIGSSTSIATVQLLKGKMLLVTVRLVDTQIEMIRKSNARVAFTTANYLSNTFPEVLLSTPQVIDALPMLLRNCPSS